MAAANESAPSTLTVAPVTSTSLKYSAQSSSTQTKLTWSAATFVMSTLLAVMFAPALELTSTAAFWAVSNTVPVTESVELMRILSYQILM